MDMATKLGRMVTLLTHEVTRPFDQTVRLDQVAN